MTVTKLVSFPISSQGPSVIADIIGTLKGVNGVESVYHGPSEDKSRGFIIVNWASLDSHKAFTSSPGFSDFKSKADAAGAASGMNEATVTFTPNPPTEALSAPVTTVVRFELKDQSFSADLHAILSQLPEKIKTVGASGGAFGKIEGAQTEGVILTGWPSVDAHKTASSQPPLSDLRPKMHALGTPVAITYVTLKKD